MKFGTVLPDRYTGADRYAGVAVGRRSTVYSLAGSLIPVRLWVFTFVTWVVIATRDGEAGTVGAAASRTHRLGPQLSLGVWRESML